MLLILSICVQAHLSHSKLCLQDILVEVCPVKWRQLVSFYWSYRRCFENFLNVLWRFLVQIVKIKNRFCYWFGQRNLFTLMEILLIDAMHDVKNEQGAVEKFLQGHPSSISNDLVSLISLYQSFRLFLKHMKRWRQSKMEAFLVLNSENEADLDRSALNGLLDSLSPTYCVAVEPLPKSRRFVGEWPVQQKYFICISPYSIISFTGSQITSSSLCSTSVRGAILKQKDI